MSSEKQRFNLYFLIPLIGLLSVACILTDGRNHTSDFFSLATSQVNPTPALPTQSLPTQPLPTQSLVTQSLVTQSSVAQSTVTQCLPTQESQDDLHGDHVEEISVDGEIRQFRLHVPPSYQSGQPMPLVLSFHGYNSNAAQQENVSQMSPKADQSGFIVAYPEGLDQTWHVGPREDGSADLKFIQVLVSNLQSRLSIDPVRIYATGISNGAQMSNLLGCKMSETFAAIAPVSGGYPPTQQCNPTRPVPVVAFHGTADRLIPYEGQGRLLMPARDWAAAWANRNGCDPTPRVSYQKGDVTGETWENCRADAEVTFYTVQGGGHSWPGSDMPADITTQDINATNVIWDFFSEHPLR